MLPDETPSWRFGSVHYSYLLVFVLSTSRNRLPNSWPQYSCFSTLCLLMLFCCASFFLPRCSETSCVYFSDFISQPQSLLFRTLSVCLCLWMRSSDNPRLNYVSSRLDLLLKCSLKDWYSVSWNIPSYGQLLEEIWRWAVMDCFFTLIWIFLSFACVFRRFQ